MHDHLGLGQEKHRCIASVTVEAERDAIRHNQASEMQLAILRKIQSCIIRKDDITKAAVAAGVKVLRLQRDNTQHYRGGAHPGNPSRSTNSIAFHNFHLC
jgi:hypothetical protein